jgi:hypothetical protein
LECGKNSTIISTVVRDDDGATDDDVTNDDDEANVGDAGGGTGGGTMRLARVATMGVGATLCKTTPDATSTSVKAPS